MKDSSSLNSGGESHSIGHASVLLGGDRLGDSNVGMSVVGGPLMEPVGSVSGRGRSRLSFQKKKSRFRDAGDVASHLQERKTSAGASVTTTGRASPLTYLLRRNQRIDMTQPKKLSFKRWCTPSFRLSGIYAHIRNEGTP